MISLYVDDGVSVGLKLLTRPPFNDPLSLLYIAGVGSCPNDHADSRLRIDVPGLTYYGG